MISEVMGLEKSPTGLAIRALPQLIMLKDLQLIDVKVTKGGMELLGKTLPQLKSLTTLSMHLNFSSVTAGCAGVLRPFPALTSGD